MKLNTTASVIVLLGAVEICSAVKEKATRMDVTDLEAVAHDLLTSPGSDKYILTRIEVQALSEVDKAGDQVEVVKNMTKALKESSLELDKRSNAIEKVSSKYDDFKTIFDRKVTNALKLAIEYKKISKLDTVSIQTLRLILKDTSNAKTKLITEQDKFIQTILDILGKKSQKIVKLSKEINSAELLNTNLINDLLSLDSPNSDKILDALVHCGVIDKNIRDSKPEDFEILKSSKTIFNDNPANLEKFALTVFSSKDLWKEIILISETITEKELGLVKEFIKWTSAKQLSFPMAKLILSEDEKSISESLDLSQQKEIKRLEKYLRTNIEKKNFDKSLKDFKFLNGQIKAINDLLEAARTRADQNQNNPNLTGEKIREILVKNGILNEIVVEQKEESAEKELGVGGSEIKEPVQEVNPSTSSQQIPVPSVQTNPSASTPNNLHTPTEITSSIPSSPVPSHWNQYKYYYFAGAAIVAICGVAYTFKDKILGSSETEL